MHEGANSLVDLGFHTLEWMKSMDWKWLLVLGLFILTGMGVWRHGWPWKQSGIEKLIAEERKRQREAGVE